MSKIRSCISDPQEVEPEVYLYNEYKKINSAKVWLWKLDHCCLTLMLLVANLGKKLRND